MRQKANEGAGRVAQSAVTGTNSETRCAMATSNATAGLRGPGELVKKATGWFIAIGVLFIVLGIFAIAEPFAAGVGGVVLGGGVRGGGGGGDFFVAFEGGGGGGGVVDFGGGGGGVVRGLLCLCATT